MKKIILITGVLFLSLNSYGSSIYVNGEIRVQQALDNVYTNATASWVNPQSCTLCHNTLAGGGGNVNPGFGALYQSVGGSGGALSIAALETIFSDPALTSVDSDNDGFTNLEEFQAGTNPVNVMDTPQAPTVTPPGGNNTGGGDGGGCGLVDDSGQASFIESSTVFGMFFLPLLFTFGFRRRSRKV